MLMRFFGRAGKGSRPGNGHAGHGGQEQDPQGRQNGQNLQPKAGGHGDHWGCVLTSDRQGELLDYIIRVANSDPHPRHFTGPAGRGLAAYSPGEQVRMAVLVQNNQVVSAYPEIQRGGLWPVEVAKVVPWANGIEGQIEGSCHGARVCFFDTRFYANGHRYRIGSTCNFRMGAFAYVLRRSADIEFEIEGGAGVSWRGAHAYLPAEIGIPEAGADIDDYWFHSPPQGEVSAVEFIGVRLWVYPITIAIPDHFEMSLPLYAADHVRAQDLAHLRPEDDLDGYLWLQGYMAED